MKKILVFHPALAPYRVDFFNALDAFYKATFYFTLKNVSDQNFDQDKLKSLCKFKCNYIEGGFEFLGRSFRFNIFRIIKRENPDIIFCAEYGPITLLVVLYKKIFNKAIKVYTLSDDSINNSISRKGLRSVLRNRISKNIDGVIFTSDEVSNWFKKNVNSETSTFNFPVIHSEISLKKIYYESVLEANNNIEQYDLVGKKIILYVGRLVEVKNLFFLINGVSKIADENIRLVLVGEGDLELELKQYVKKIGLESKVLFIGRKEGVALYNWYLFSQIFVLPSVYEPFGAVVNEALVGGCFVMCSRLAGAATLINTNNGVLFDPENEKDFVNKLNVSILNFDALKYPLTGLRSNKMPFLFEDKMTILLSQL